MSIRRISWVLAFVVGLGGAPARAVELVAGGYGTVESTTESPWPAAKLLAFEASTPLVLHFTPRMSGALLLGNELRQRDADESPSFGPSAFSPLTTLDRLGFVTSVGQDEFRVGGAFRLDDVTVSAGFARPVLFGTPAELFAAGIAVGGWSASFAYARRPDAESGPLDMLLLRTDLRALPWLALESEMAISERQASGALAAGRIGIRLDF